VAYAAGAEMRDSRKAALMSGTAKLPGLAQPLFGVFGQQIAQ
jgi:hypothetical protein